MKIIRTSLSFLLPIAIFGGILYYLLFLDYVGINKVGIAWNSSTNKITVQEPGWHKTSFDEFVFCLPTTPIVVTLPSKAKVVNSKLVRFRKEGAEQFVDIQGFGWYSDQDFENVMLGFAFSGKKYPFLEVIGEARVDPSQIASQ